MYRLDPASLNPPQLEAVTHRAGPMLVLAGAGSGKTRVITHRIAHMISTGVHPESIVAVSFTNKAANEMRERVAALVGKETSRKIKLSTFHALGAEILRRDIQHLGYRSPFAICDAGDQKSLLKELLKELRLQGTAMDPDALIGVLSRSKMNFCSPSALPGMRFNPRRRAFEKLYEAYNRALRALNAVDFDDLIGLPVKLFREHPDVLAKYHYQWRYLMVDEYQDTNGTQFALLKLLAQAENNVMVVGDDDQSIYGFRGADSTHILSFAKHFPGAQMVALEQNYRSTRHILDAANAVISNNPTRHEKRLWSAGEAGPMLRHYSCKDEMEEARLIADEIGRMREDHGLRFGDFSLLYRTNPQSRVFEEALQERAVPYRMVGGTRFYDRKEIRDVVAMLKLVSNPRDDLSLRRVINVPPRGIGPGTISKLDDVARGKGLSLFDALKRELGSFESKRSQTQARNFVEVIERLHRESLKSSSLSEIGRQLLADLRYVGYLRSSGSNDEVVRRRVENVEELLNALANFERRSDGNLTHFLERVALEPSDTESKEEDENKLVMMTLHSAKGLEFPAVFLVGCEEGLLPHARSLKERGGVEEERRLFYVGITRSKKHLVLTSARTRTHHGDSHDCAPSRFLEEIPKEVIEISGQAGSDANKRLTEMRQQTTKKYLSKLRALIDAD